jgi:hypothetical protein
LRPKCAGVATRSDCGGSALKADVSALADWMSLHAMPLIYDVSKGLMALPQGAPSQSVRIA